jgi:hypothetical protein
MRHPRKRSIRLAVEVLDHRVLPSDLSGVWLGQDGHDFVGPSTAPAPDGVQDIHIQLSGIPAGRQVVFVDVQGLGGGDWQYNGPYGPWAVAVLQAPGSTTTDLYFEPYQTETGRPFSVSVRYDDRSTDSTWLAGGTADPNLRMPAASLSVDSATQDGNDLVGTGPNVGPDGFQDLVLHLSGLSPNVAVQSLVVSNSTGPAWTYGANPTGLNNAELVVDRGDASQANLYLQPTRDLNGQSLTLALAYANGKTDATTFDVSIATPAELPVAEPAPLPLERTGPAGQWMGQDGLNLTGPGDVHLAVSNLPAGRSVVAATLNDPEGGLWAFASSSAASYYIDPFTAALGVRVLPGGHADLGFQPIRDETGATLTLRLQFDDGSIALVPIAGGAADLGLRGAEPQSTAVVAHPGDHLSALANTYGTVELSPGVYNLSQPLVLNNAVTIAATAPGATLLFSQSAQDTPWTTAIRVQASHVTLQGFAIRCAGTVNWNHNVQFGPAVIGSGDNLDPRPAGDPLVGLTFQNLDIQSPPAATPWEAAPALFRLDTATSGIIANNTLDGGTTEIANGPWTIANNKYVGTVADTYTPTAFAAHHVHDLVIASNHLQPSPGSGKTYRFLVMNQGGVNDSITNNTVIGIGPMDSDTEPSNNSSEVLLTEDYALHFEGMPLAISSDGNILQIPQPRGGAARAGDVVAILSGPDAGQWRTIAQAIDPGTYLMESPLPSGSYAISICSGFANETYSGNTINTTGGSTDVDLDLQGGQFGVRVTQNTLIGGAAGLIAGAPPSNVPSSFGWSHAPFFGATISGNVIRDASVGAALSVEHGASIKSSVGRVYWMGSLEDTTIQWTDAYFAGHTRQPVALTIGESGGLDPGELRIALSGTAFQVGPSQSMSAQAVVNLGVVNGKAMTNATIGIPRLISGPVTGLALVNDTGVSSVDRLTIDGRLRFDSVAGFAGYEYSVGATPGAFAPVSNPAGFLPAGLVQGWNTVWVRAVDVFGNRGPATSIQFQLDTIPPVAKPPMLSPASDSGISDTDGITNVASPTFLVSGDTGDSIVLFRNGTALAGRIGPGTLTEPSVLPDGTYFYSLLRLDAAGNASLSGATVVIIERTPPPIIGGLHFTATSQLQFLPVEAGDSYQYRVGPIGAYTNIGWATSFVPAGLAPGLNLVSARAVDLAGNVGPAASLVLNTSPQTPSGVWLGQDGTDLVGLSSKPGPDGVQDIHIALAGLRKGRTIASIDVRAAGGGEWMYHGHAGVPAAALVRSPGATTGDLYIDPVRVETGRPFTVQIVYNNQQRDNFVVLGGLADPSLAAPAVFHVNKPARRTRAF